MQRSFVAVTSMIVTLLKKSKDSSYKGTMDTQDSTLNKEQTQKLITGSRIMMKLEQEH